MSSILPLALSFTERLLPRVASALVMLLLAVFVTPREVGLYATVMLAFTFLQSVSDGAARQVSVEAVASIQGRRFLRRYAAATKWGGSTLLVLTILAVALFSPDDLRAQALALLPLAIVPIATASRVVELACLQIDDRWGSLARIQSVAAIISLLISVPLLVWTHSLVACAVQLALTEVIAAVMMRRAARGTSSWGASAVSNPDYEGARHFLHLSAYSALSWVQGQADRLLLLLFAGGASLGLYSFGFALGRAPADALSASTANVARPVLLVRGDRRRFEHMLEIGVLLYGLLYVAVVLFTQVVVAPLLDSEWDPAIAAVAVFAMSGFFSIVEWSSPTALLAVRRIRWASGLKAVAVVFAVPIALSAISSIELAAWWYVARELVVATAATAVARFIAWRALLLAIIFASIAAVVHISLL